jgi:photosystem II stability/assembly factor-like uncharacterized protein
MRIFTIALFFALALSFEIKAQDTVRDYKSYPYWIGMMQNPEANFYETQNAFNEYWENREVTRGNGFKAFKRWEYWMSKKVLPDGTKPSPQRNINAIQLLRSNAQSNTNQYLAGTGRSSMTNGNWTPLGPASVPSGYNGYRGLGRVNAIAFHPTDATTLYAGAPAGGLWVTNNSGSTWTTYTDNLPTLGVSSIIVDHLDPNIIYIGTGDRDHGDAPGAGVWKSIDGGLTFQPSNAGMTTSTVGKMVIHPIDNMKLIAATNNGLFRTVNGGVSWTNVSSGNYKDVVLKPDDPNIVYATRSGNFYRSDNNGQSFTQITNGLPTSSRGAIAVSPANPSVVYFIITNDDSFKGLYRSTDSGLSFSVRSTTPNIMSWGCTGGSGGQAWYDLDIACDPLNADIIYAGGVNCFKSVNGGQTWVINSHWWGDCGVPSVHADLHVLEYNPINNRLYAGNDGGVYWTNTGGTSWNEISNGLVISQAYKIGQSATNKDYVINGYQDNGTSTIAGADWINVNGGDGMQCAFDPTSNDYSYSTLYYGPVYRHINQGDGDQIAGNGVNGIDESGGWVTPFVIDHVDGNIMFIGYDNVWRSTNIKTPNTGNVTWTKISNLNVNNFEEMAQSDANTNILYVSNGSSLYRSDNVKDANVTWANITGSLLSGNTITAIETNLTDENIVYLVQQNQVFKSQNKGSSWTNITGNLPDVQMHTLVYYHNSNEGLYLGTDIGVFYRDAVNSQWIEYSTGLPAAVWVTELEIYYDSNPALDVLRAGTFGRGLWSSPLINTAPPAAAGAISGPESVCASQMQVVYSIDPIIGADTYVWTLPEGASGSSDSTSIIVNFGTNAVSGEISVYGVNAYGNGVGSSLFLTVTSLPLAAGTISGAMEVCQSQMSVLYSVPEITGTTFYEWSLPPGASGASTSNEISVDYSSTATTGTISVYGGNACGNGEASNSQVIVNMLPSDAGIIAGAVSVCQGDQEVLYSVPEIDGATSYEWTLPQGALGLSDSNTIVVNFGIDATSGIISVAGINDCGTGAESTLPVEVKQLPTTPYITQNGHDLHSDSPEGNQWYTFAGLIEGATAQDYEVTWDDFYYTIVTLNGCVSDTSNVLQVIVSDVFMANLGAEVMVYPNPVINELTLEKRGNMSTLEFKIIKASGETILKGTFTDKKVIATSDYSQGLYLVIINDGNFTNLIKFVKE